MSTDSTLPRPRVIVLCFDGTANQYDETNTNVVKLYALIDKSCPLDQIVYYQPGVGTFFEPGVVSPLLTWLAKMADQAVAWYLNEHVMRGYKFLMQNYRAGDKICLFGEAYQNDWRARIRSAIEKGFSRGAYTARALAGFLHKIGLLPRDNGEQVPFAYALYQRTDEAGLELAAGFKRTFCAPVNIDFVGVWDTVASVGILYGRNLPFTSANSAVRVFRHALSLDEHRARFQPNLFHHEAPEDTGRHRHGPRPSTAADTTTEPQTPESGEKANPRPRPKFGLTRWGVAVQRHSAQEQYRIRGSNRAAPSNPEALSPERKEPSGTPSRTSDPLPAVEEVWFAGCHSDVGGGAVEDTVRYSLAGVSLRWMVKQVIISQCGIKFEAAALRRADIDVSTIVLVGPTQPTVEQVWRKKSEAEAGASSQASPGSSGEDGSGEYMFRGGKDKDVEAQAWPREQDVLADTHDQLKSQPLWWLLELIPMKFTWQEADGTWRSKLGINFGRGRQIRAEQPIFHDTVRQRMAIEELKYEPRARWTLGTERYVE